MKTELRKIMATVFFWTIGMFGVQGLFAQVISLDFYADNMNRQCPLSITETTKLTKAEFAEGNVVFHIMAKEPDFNIKELNNNADYWQILLKDQYDKSSGNAKQILKLIGDNDANLKIICKGETSGDTAVCLLKNEDLKSIISRYAVNAGTSDKELLEKTIIILNGCSPMAIGNGIKMTSGSIAENNVILDCIIDENVLDMDVFMKESGNIKKFLLSHIPLNEAAQIMAKQCVNNKMNLMFRYQGSKTFKVVYIILNYSELQKSLSK